MEFDYLDTHPYKVPAVWDELGPMATQSHDELVTNADAGKVNVTTETGEIFLQVIRGEQEPTKELASTYRAMWLENHEQLLSNPTQGWNKISAILALLRRELPDFHATLSAAPPFAMPGVPVDTYHGVLSDRAAYRFLKAEPPHTYVVHHVPEAGAQNTLSITYTGKPKEDCFVYRSSRISPSHARQAHLNVEGLPSGLINERLKEALAALNELQLDKMSDHDITSLLSAPGTSNVVIRHRPEHQYWTRVSGLDSNGDLRNVVIQPEVDGSGWQIQRGGIWETYPTLADVLETAKKEFRSPAA